MPASATEHRITARVRLAVELMVHKGYARDKAAIAANLKPHSFLAALHKPHVRAFKTSLQRAMIDGEAERSVHTMIALRDHADSEHVRLAAAQHIAALGGIRPPEQAGLSVNISAGGLMVDLRGFGPAPLIHHHQGDGSKPLIEHDDHQVIQLAGQLDAPDDE